MRQQYALRSMILVVFLALAGVAILVQMVRIHSQQAQAFLLQGDRYSGEFQTIYPERGELYDRDGHLLAGNRTVYEVGVSLREVKDEHAMAYALSMYHRPGREVQNHGQIPWPFTDRDLVDGQLGKFAQLRSAEVLLQIALLDLLDQVPADVQMPGDVLNRHVPAKLQGIARKGSGVAAPLIGKSDRNLPDGRALAALHPGDPHLNRNRFSPDGHLAPQPMDTTMLDQIVAAADRAAQRKGIWLHGKEDSPADIGAANIRVSSDPPSMVKQTRGDTLALLSESWLAL